MKFVLTLMSLACLGTTVFADELKQLKNLESEQFTKIESFEEYAKKNGLLKRINDRLADAEIKIGSKLFSISDEESGVNLAARYRREVEGAGVSGLWLRSDSYELTGGINAGNLILGMGSPIGLGLEKETKLKFIRPYTDRNEAFLSIQTDDNLKKIPVNSEIAMNNLLPGDYFSTTANMNLFLGFNGSVSPTAGVDIGGKAYYILKGKFLVQTYKMADNKIRVKIFAGESKRREASADLGIGYEFFQINPGSSIAEKIVEKVLDFDLLEVLYQKDKGQVMVFDYIFDLDYPEVRDAFDQLMSPKMLIKDAQIAARIFTGGNTAVATEKLLSNISYITKIAQVDASVAEKRIEKGFQGQFDFNTEKIGFDLNLLIFKWQRSRAYARNNIIRFNDGNDEYYYAPSFTKFEEVGFDIGIIDLKAKRTSSMFSIFNSNPESDEFDFSQIGTINNTSEATMTVLEEGNLKRQLSYNLANIDEFKKFSTWGWSENLALPARVEKREVNVRSQFFVNENGLRYLRENYKSLKDYRRAIDAIYLTAQGSYKRNPIFRRMTRSEDYKKNDRRARRLARDLFKIIDLSSDLTSSERVERLMSFRSRYNFRKYMPFLVKSLITDEEAFKKSVYYHIEMSHEGKSRENALVYTYGVKDSRGLYRQLRSLESTFSENDKESYILFRNTEDADFFE